MAAFIVANLITKTNPLKTWLLATMQYLSREILLSQSRSAVLNSVLADNIDRLIYFDAKLLLSIRKLNVNLVSDKKHMHTKEIDDLNAVSSPHSWHHNRLTIVIHWLVTLFLPVMAGLGWYMLSIESLPGSSWYFDLHKSLGMVFGMLVVFRLAWRFFHPPAPLPRSVPVWQAQLAHWMQGLLYFAMILMPITGYLGSAFGTDPLSFFGFNLSKWPLPNHVIAELIFNIHGVVIWVLICLVSIHALGALKHLLVDKDGVFQRMWFK